ncbi:MAG: hypothetical protein H7Z43_13780 [Clostridia bacterium]|nr:hypothetical protein [Deltaproteobacteria bacterium]
MIVAVAVLATVSSAPAVPQFVVDERVGNPAALTAIAEEQWTAMAELTARVIGAPIPHAPITVHIVPGRELRSSEAGTSRYGRIELRTGASEITTALRHELGHQYLWATCPAALDDRLFHEAFALIVSGELTRWDEADVTTPQAVRVLAEASSLDVPKSRAAIARLIRESLTDSIEIPRTMALRLATCSSNTLWRPLQVNELAPAERAYSDAFVVVNRHSGELVTFDGAVDTAMPFGSVLKPFIVAGAAGAPTLKPVHGDVNWECGDALPSQLTAAQALARSCNGYFLTWGRTTPAAAKFGAYGAMLTALGLPRLPNAMSEAIGITPTLALTPRAVAEAYRALALSSPTTIAALADTARFGTLAGLGLGVEHVVLSARGASDTNGASNVHMARAFKTGTVRNPQSRPLVGWLVQVTPDHVAVSTFAGRQPRDFAVQAAQRLTAIGRRAQERRVGVQVFGLVGASQVTVECRGVAMRGADVVQTQAPVPLSSVLEDSEFICLGAPWLARVGGSAPGSSTVAGAARRSSSFGAENTRDYAGTFARAELPASNASDDTTASPRALRARRGSEVIFTTSLGAYAAGVAHQEGGMLHGATREALVRVIAHNAYEPRHAHRPICDTTHCQVFKGTMHLGDDDARSLTRSIPYRGWLPFALGGDAPWEKAVDVQEITRVLGSNAAQLRLGPDYVTFIRTTDDTADESVRVRCEVIRNALHLLSCPTSVAPGPNTWMFRGKGAGHALGLNLIRAQLSAQSADSLLQSAFGPAPRL